VDTVLNITPLRVSENNSSTLKAGHQAEHGDEKALSGRTAEVARQFEALLIFTMMKSMRASLSENTLTGSDQQDMYREMMDREIAESIARRGDFGLTKMFASQLAESSETNTVDRVRDTQPVSTDIAHRGYTLDKNTGVAEFVARQRILQAGSWN